MDKWEPTPINQLPSWENATVVGFDTETRDETIKKLGTGCRRENCYVVGYSFCLDGGKPYYVPIRQEGGGNLDRETAIQYLRDQAKVFSGEMVGMNLAYDLDYVNHEFGIWFDKVSWFRDIANADPLIYELHDFYSMEHIAKRHGLEGKDETVLRKIAEEYKVDPKGGLWKLPAWAVGAYAAQDALLPMQVYEKQKKLIAAQHLQQIFDLESQVLPVLVRMTARGVRVDMQHLEYVENYSLQEEAEALRQVQHLTGVKIKLGDVWKAGALAPALEAIGIKLPKTATGKPSIKKDDLIAYDHPVAQALSRARIVNKLRTTFAQSVRTHMVNERIHCTFHQISREAEDGEPAGVRYGRLSCVHPNMQQQPSRGEFASMWRKIYIPEEGRQWCSNDFSQQEPRWTTHFAELLNLPKAREAAEAYRTDPKLDNHDMMSKLTGLPRKEAKAVYLGLCYGEGGAKFCRTTGLPTRWCLRVGGYDDQEVFYFEHEKEAREAARSVKDRKKFLYEAAGVEGQRILDQFNEQAPFIKKLAKEVQKAAEQRGWIKTILGRKLHFEEKPDCSGYEYVYKALNRLIQGSSADQVKKAMVDLDKGMPGLYTQLQVHDELDASVSSICEAREAAEIMINAVKSSIPFRVDTEIGPSWGEIKEIEVA